MNKMKKYALSTLYDMSSGISSTKEQAGHGSPFVSFSTVFNNYFLPDELPDLMDTTEKEQEVYSIKKGDIFITRTSETIDELAMSCVATKDYPCATYSGFTKRLRPKTEGIAYYKYMAFYLRSDWFRKAVTNNAFMTLRASFNEDIFSFLNVYLPDYDVQVRIGDFLYSIEQKIGVNKRICLELESILQLIYDYWFVQFDFPNTDEQPYRTAGGEMEWNEHLKRKIPKGWDVDFIGNILAKVPNTTRIQTGDYLAKGKIPIIDQSADFIVGYTNNSSSVLTDPTGYVIFGDHTRIVKYARFPFARGADGTQILKSNTARIPDELLYQIIRSVDLSNYGYARHFKFLKDTPTIIPTESIAKKFAEITTPIYDKHSNLILENIELTNLRDWLLPMLMNGQATVAE